MSDYETKADLKNAASIDILHFPIKTDLKSDIEKLDIGKLKKYHKVYILDFVKLETSLVSLSKLSHAVNNRVLKKTEYNKLV